MKKSSFITSPEALYILNILLITGPLLAVFLPKEQESMWGYLALTSFIAWVPVGGFMASIVAIHQLMTASKKAPGTRRTFGTSLAIVTLLLNLLALYVVFVAKKF